MRNHRNKCERTTSPSHQSSIFVASLWEKRWSLIFQSLRKTPELITTLLPGWKYLLPGDTTPLQVEPHPVFPFPSDWASSVQLQADDLWKVPCMLVARSKWGSSRIFRVRDHSHLLEHMLLFSRTLWELWIQTESSQKETKGTFNSRLKVRTLHPASHGWGLRTKNRKPHFFFN